MSSTEIGNQSYQVQRSYPLNVTNRHDRVRSMTPEKVNQKIDLKTERILLGVITQGPNAIRQRLDEIDQEWNIDRVLMFNFSTLIFIQLLAATRNRKWLWGPLIQTPFLMLHSTLGWCPPSLWFRPMGFRTQKEIQAEREILLEALEDSEFPDNSPFFE